MSDKEWETAEKFKYDPFQAFWDFEFNHSQKNDKLRNNQSFSEAWNHQKNKIKKLQAENKKLKECVERIEFYDLHSDTGFAVLECLRIDARQCLKEITEQEESND